MHGKPPTRPPVAFSFDRPGDESGTRVAGRASELAEPARTQPARTVPASAQSGSAQSASAQSGSAQTGSALPDRHACRAEHRQLQCERCGGEDYLTRAGADLAEAALCSHLEGCPACRGSGFRPGRDAEGYEVMRPCSLQALKHRIQLYNLAGIPSAYHGVRLDPTSYEHRGGNQSEVLLRKFVAWHKQAEASVQPGGKLPRPTKGIGLSGRPGVGKTHLMAALARELTLELGVPTRFADFSQLLWSLRAGFDAGQGESQLIAPLVGVEVLLVDEMGKGRGSEWEIGILDAIVSERYNRGLTTFFSTNYPFARPQQTPTWNDKVRTGDTQVETLAERVGDRIASRLAAMCELVVLDGPDSRALPPARQGRRPG